MMYKGLKGVQGPKTCQAYFAELIAVVSNILCNIKIQLGSEDMTNSISGVLTFIWGVIFGDIQNHILQYNLSYNEARVLKFGKYMQRKSTKDSQEAEFWILDFFRFYWFFSVFKARGGSGGHFCMFGSYESTFYRWTATFYGTKISLRVKKFLIFFWKYVRNCGQNCKNVRNFWTKLAIFPKNIKNSKICSKDF